MRPNCSQRNHKFWEHRPSRRGCTLPYLFLYEDVFVLLISLVIGGVLFLRWQKIQERKK